MPDESAFSPNQFVFSIVERRQQAFHHQARAQPRPLCQCAAKEPTVTCKIVFGTPICESPCASAKLDVQ